MIQSGSHLALCVAFLASTPAFASDDVREQKHQCDREWNSVKDCAVHSVLGDRGTDWVRQQLRRRSLLRVGFRHYSPRVLKKDFISRSTSDSFDKYT
jgi:hypothetical protein